jgi:hypothetical protein
MAGRGPEGETVISRELKERLSELGWSDELIDLFIGSESIPQYDAVGLGDVSRSLESFESNELIVAGPVDTVSVLYDQEDR